MQAELLRPLTEQGLQAVQAACKIGQEATTQVEQMATAPELKALLKRGHEHSLQWTERVSKVQQATHGTNQEGDNPIIRAHQEVAHRISEHAKNPQERDLGLIASGQLALHYYIGAFGTLASYIEATGHPEEAKTLKQCGDEAKQGDEAYTQLAKQMLQRT